MPVCTPRAIGQLRQLFPFAPDRLWARLTTVLAVPLIVLLLLGGLRLSVLAGAPALSTADNEIELSGLVVRVPGNAQGEGVWTIRTQSGRIYRVIADGETEFKPQPPAVNQHVQVRGVLRRGAEGDELLAKRIEVEQESGDNGDDDRLIGIIDARPANGIGLWTIQSGLTLTVNVLVDGSTRLDDGVPPEESWVEVRGRWQPDNTFRATRIRIENHRVSEVVVRLASGVISATVASRYNLLPKATLLSSGNIYLFATADDEERNVVTQLAADADILWAELNFVGGIPQGHTYKTWRWGGTTPDGYVNQNAFAQVNLAPVLGEVQGAGIVIAILDTGINQSHAVFADRLLPGYDMVADDADPEDEGDGLGWGHGTHVAGIIAQMSPQSKLLPVRVLDANGRGTTFALAYGIEWAVEQGADVINLSLGADANSRVLQDVITQAIAQEVIVVAAAGNAGTDEPQFPASFPAVISVTAVDGNNTKADFASFGAGWVDLAAPGVGITSTVVGPYGSGYASWSGTSMATGFVSGAAALARQQLPTASVAAISDLFTAQAQNLDNNNPAYAGKLGGLLDVAAALEFDSPAATPTPTVTPTPLPPTPTDTSPSPATATPTPLSPGSGEQQQLFLPVVRQ
jgi:subtilisin family serine protease